MTIVFPAATLLLLPSVTPCLRFCEATLEDPRDEKPYIDTSMQNDLFRRYERLACYRSSQTPENGKSSDTVRL